MKNIDAHTGNSNVIAESHSETSTATYSEAHLTRVVDRSISKLRTRWLVILPFVAAVAYCAYLPIHSVRARLLVPYPLHPWESAIICDAYRVVRGKKVYEEWPRGHATHMYGPLVTYAPAAVFKVRSELFGLQPATLYAARGIALGASLVTCVILVWCCARRRSFLCVLLSIGLFVSLHHRARSCFTEPRLDIAAVLFAVLAVVAYARAHSRERWWWYAPGIAATLTAFLIKQPYCAVAAVPLLAVLLLRPSAVRTHLLWAATPLVAISAVIALLPLVFENLHHYMLSVAMIYPLLSTRIDDAAWGIAIELPTLLVSCVVLRQRLLGSPKDARVAWALSATLIGLPSAFVTMSKHGGSYNSMLLFYVPALALFMLALPLLVDLLHSRPVPHRLAWGLSMLLAIAIVHARWRTPSANVHSFERSAFGDRRYQQVVDFVRDSALQIVCPDDPSITLMARGQVGRCLQVERDAAGLWNVWGRQLPVPDPVLGDIREAEAIICVDTPYYSAYLTSDIVSEMGFTRYRTSVFGDVYALWVKQGQNPWIRKTRS